MGNEVRIQEHQEQGGVRLEEEVQDSAHREQDALCALFMWFHVLEIQALWFNRTMQSMESKQKFEQEYGSNSVSDKRYARSQENPESQAQAL